MNNPFLAMSDAYCATLVTNFLNYLTSIQPGLKKDMSPEEVRLLQNEIHSRINEFKKDIEDKIYEYAQKYDGIKAGIKPSPAEIEKRIFDLKREIKDINFEGKDLPYSVANMIEFTKIRLEGLHNCVNNDLANNIDFLPEFLNLAQKLGIDIGGYAVATAEVGHTEKAWSFGSSDLSDADISASGSATFHSTMASSAALLVPSSALSSPALETFSVAAPSKNPANYSWIEGEWKFNEAITMIACKEFLEYLESSEEKTLDEIKAKSEEIRAIYNIPAAECYELKPKSPYDSEEQKQKKLATGEENKETPEWVIKYTKPSLSKVIYDKKVSIEGGWECLQWDLQNRSLLPQFLDLCKFLGIDKPLPSFEDAGGAEDVAAQAYSAPTSSFDGFATASVPASDSLMSALLSSASSSATTDDGAASLAGDTVHHEE